ncbi:MAG TPA: DUF975 family protein [Paenibacillus sp.]|uniref:DUF975 family protein n=1 Tax=Paenibacillus sp. TaxID=58172 RepID=UPI0028D6ACE5|nr:DUF975 family protein [Paenibacillus sp.]HUC92147.1 DUF975 family protein [Paenibacillus sp.]
MNGFLTRPEIRAAARESLSGKWGKAVAITLIYYAILIAAEMVPLVGSIVSLLISGAFALGIALYFLGLARSANPPVATMFEGFRRFGKTLGLYLLIAIFTFLWMLLLVVPGIIAGYRYSQAYFILIDNPDIGPLEAIRRSKDMMAGHKWRLFVLHLSFIGWFLLSLLTLGIGLLWLYPYYMASTAHFYDNLRSLGSSSTSIGWVPPSPAGYNNPSEPLS